MYSDKFKKNVYDFNLGAIEYKNIMNLLKRKAPFLKPKQFNSEESAENKHGLDIVYIGKGYYDSWGEEDIRQHINVIFYMEIMDCITLDWYTYSEPYQQLLKDIYTSKHFDKLTKGFVNDFICERFKELQIA